MFSKNISVNSENICSKFRVNHITLQCEKKNFDLSVCLNLYKSFNHFFYTIHNFFSISFYFNTDFKISFYNDISNIYFLNLNFMTNNSIVKKVSFFL